MRELRRVLDSLGVDNERINTLEEFDPRLDIGATLNVATGELVLNFFKSSVLHLDAGETHHERALRMDRLLQEEGTCSDCGLFSTCEKHSKSNSGSGLFG